MNITNVFIKNDRVTFVLLFLIILGGIQAYTNFPRDEDPEISIPTALVMTYNPGMSPVDVELLISDKIEKKIQELPELDYVQSENRTGVSIITVEIKDQYKDLPPIWQRLRNKVENAEGELPEGTTKPFVWDDFGDVFGIVLAVTGEGFTYREIEDVTDDLKKEINLLPGVSKVELYGVQEERVFIEVSNARLGAFGMSPTELMQLLADENIVLPGGQVFVGPEKIIIEPSGNYENVDDIRMTVVSKPGDIEVVYLKDMAQIKREYIDPPRVMTRQDGVRCIVVAVSMAKGGNIVELGDTVNNFLGKYEPKLPVGMNIDFVEFQPTKVIKATNDFMLNLLQAILIVSIVMILSLGLRTGAIVATLIPMSILATFVFMSFFNIELQRVSIASLIIALGLMVDCGIVMSENIMVLLSKGVNRLEACVKTGKELLVPLLTSTLTTCAAFLPIALAKARVGEYCLSLFQVVSISLLCSWFLGLTMIPLLCFHFLRFDRPEKAIFSNRNFRLGMISLLYVVCIFFAKLPILLLVVILPFLVKKYIFDKKSKDAAEKKPEKEHGSPFYKKYLDFLTYVLTHRKRCLLGLLVVFIISLWAFGFVKKIFFPPSDRPQYMVDFELPEGTSIYTTSRELKKFEKFLSEQEEITSYTSYIGEGGPRFYLSYGPKQSRENYAFVLVNCGSFYDVEPLIIRTREFLSENVPYARPKVKPLDSGVPVDEPIEVRISGDDIDTLYTLADQVKKELGDIAGAYNIRDDWGTKTKKIVVDINQAKAKRVGLSSRDVADSLKMLLDEQEATLYREEDKNIPVTLRAEGASRKDVGKVESLNVYSSVNEQSIPLSQIAEDRIEWENSQIYRRNRWRTMKVLSQVEPGYVATDVLKVLEPKMKKISRKWPPGYKYKFGGEKEESDKAQNSIAEQFPIAVFIIVMLMIVQFNSLRRMTIIILTIPMAIIGVTVGLLVTDLPFGFMALLGYISLAGIVINNAIVLIDRIELNIQEGNTPQRSVILAALSRTRPIVLTSVTTVGGLIPLALGGGEFWAPMAVTIMAGLIFSTVLTLGFVPMLYSMFFKINYEEKDFAI